MPSSPVERITLPILRSIVTTLASLVIVIIILAAVVLGMARLLLPMAGQYRVEIAQQLSESVSRPVTIGGLDATWQGMNPYLQLNDVRIFDKAGTRTLLHFADVRIGVSVPYYLRHGRLEQGSLKVSGTTLSLIRRADGSITVKGFEQNNSPGRFKDWLLSQNQLSIEASQLYWTDQQVQGRRLHFSDINVSLHSNGRRHQMEGTLKLAAARGLPLRFALDFAGELTDPSKWSGKLYAQGIGLDMARWIDTPATMGVDLTEGQANFRLWGAWANTELQKLQGEVAAYGLGFTGARGKPLNIALSGASAQLRWQRKNQDWALDIARLVLERGDERMPPGQVQIRSSAETGVSLMDVRFNQLPIKDVSTLLLASDVLEPGMHDALRTLRPRGELRDLHLRMQMKKADPEKEATNEFYIETQLAGVTTQVWKKLPAMQNISARLRADNSGIALEVDSRQVKLDFAKMFRAPIDIDSLSGQLNWQDTGQGWLLRADNIHARNADISASLNGTMHVPADKVSPFLNLRVAIENVNIADIDGYLPINLIPPKALSWLEKSLVSGYITTGSVLVHGRARDFPFKSNQGMFEARLNVANAVVDYKADWPQLADTNASVIFRGVGMEADATGGAIFNTDVVQIHAAIPNLTVKQPELILTGKVRGSATDALHFLKEGPLRKKFLKYVSKLDASGQSEVAVDLLIPLKKGKNRVKGTLQVVDTTLHYLDEAQGRNIKINDITGVLDFTEASLAGENIKAEFLGQALHANVATSSAEQGATGETLLIDARGTISAAQIVEQLRKNMPDMQAGLADQFEGTTAWTAALDFHDDADANLQVDLTVKSDLQGMAVALPAPVGKSTDETIPLTIKTTFSDTENKLYSISYGERVDAIVEVSQTGKDFELSRGDVQFGGANKPALPSAGLHIGGSLPRFSLEAWNKVLATGDDGNQSGVMQSLAQVDIDIGVLEAFNQKLTDTQIMANKTRQQWSISLTSDQAAGTIILPQNVDAVWTMNFERLHLAKPENENTRDSTFDPRRLPALDISSKSFKYNDHDLGQLKLATSKRPSGMHVDTFRLQAPTMNVTGQGDWINEGNAQVSRFDFEVDSEELGKTLAVWGYDTNIAGGKAHIDLTAHWTGSPMNFALDRLNGTLVISIEQGRFLDIDPGAGRVFGLLSIQALPRRLSLDFSDIFKKGFAFDSIVSEFTLKDGTAYTNNLLMKGPSATVSVTGKTDLAAKDYDQIVTVKPQIGVSLPLAATIAGGPIAGAAVFLAQKIFQPQIDSLTDYQYTIKGTWADPIIDRIESKNASEAAN